MTNSTAALVASALDSDRLSELCGREVRATSLRIKPDTALVLGWCETQNPNRVGWARFLFPVQHSKAEKIEKIAQKKNLEVSSVRLNDELIFQQGEFLADPKLVHLLDNLSLDKQKMQVLRYNPLRRLVYSQDGAAVRVTAGQSPLRSELMALIESKVPVPQVTSAHQHLLSTALVGSGDLTDLEGVEPLTESALAFRVGALFAPLHACVNELTPSLSQALEPLRVDARKQAQAHCQLLELLAPELLGRVSALAEKLEPIYGSPVLVHGDASPDQVLVDEASGKTWLTDFDRVHLAPAAVDLGAYFAAATLSAPAQDAFLEGYTSAGGLLPSAENLRRARVHSLMNRLLDPLRKANPKWRSALEGKLSELEELTA